MCVSSGDASGLQSQRKHGHTGDRDKEWILLCLFREPDSEMNLSQEEQVKGLSLVCVLW